MFIQFKLEGCQLTNIVELTNISLIRENKLLLNDISWEINQNEHWCLLGLNGCGKTTLLNVINGYIWPTKGEATILNHTFGATNLPEMRKEIGWVSSSLQQRFPEDETAITIVLSGKFASIGLYESVTQEEIKRANQLLKQLKCQHFANQLYRTLSQGERQRVLIARALMASPKLLILDEPCTGLDLLAKEQLLLLIQQIAIEPDGPTLIYVTHHVEEILSCFTYTMLMKEGRVFSAGKTADLLTEDRLSAFFEQEVLVQKIKDRTWLSLKEKVTY